MNDEKIIEQLNDFYFENETWHQKKLSRIEAYKYHAQLLSTGNIITVTSDNILCGYVELWKVNFEQWGRIVCGEPFSAVCEDVQTGWIAVVGNTYISPDYRDSSVAKQLRDRFFEVTKECRFFVGEAKRKKAGYIKVFKKEDIMRFNKVGV